MASAVTRDPVHIALVGVATRLPWLLFSLPAGVITDRVDRRRLVVVMDALRAIVTIGVAIAVLVFQSELSSPELIAAGQARPTGRGRSPPRRPLRLRHPLRAGRSAPGQRRSNSDAFVVDKDNLEKANGRLWGAEMVTNSFVGPPLGGFLLAVAFSLPFFVDAGTFAVSAAMVAFLAGSFRPQVKDVLRPRAVVSSPTSRRGFAGSGITAFCGPWQSSWACSTPPAERDHRHHGPVRPGSAAARRHRLRAARLGRGGGRNPRQLCSLGGQQSTWARPSLAATFVIGIATPPS